MFIFEINIKPLNLAIEKRYSEIVEILLENRYFYEKIEEINEIF